MAKHFWITRDSPDSPYEIFEIEPHWTDFLWAREGCGGCTIPAEDFEYYFGGLKLKGGPRSITKRRLAK